MCAAAVDHFRRCYVGPVRQRVSYTAQSLRSGTQAHIVSLLNAIAGLPSSTTIVISSAFDSENPGFVDKNLVRRSIPTAGNRFPARAINSIAGEWRNREERESVTTINALDSGGESFWCGGGDPWVSRHRGFLVLPSRGEPSHRARRPRPRLCGGKPHPPGRSCELLGCLYQQRVVVVAMRARNGQQGVVGSVGVTEVDEVPWSLDGHRGASIVRR